MRPFRGLTVVAVVLAVAAGAAPVRAAPASRPDPRAAAAWVPGAAVSRSGTRVESAVPGGTYGTVAETAVSIYQPLPAGSAPHPAACDWLSYLRFRTRNGPTDPLKAATVIVAQPGAEGGASSLDSVARTTLADAAKPIELWALDRRSNCLEDQTGMRAALAARDPAVAVGYYFAGRTVNGKRFAGFPTNDQLAWLADLGLVQTVRDEYDLLLRELPSAAYRAEHTVCAGHSLGGIVTAYLAEWDGDGNAATTADAGYRQCSSYVAFDTLISTDFGLVAATSPYPAAQDLIRNGYDAVVDALHAGTLPRAADLPAVISPETVTFQEIAGMAAMLDPDGVSDLARITPRNDKEDLTLRLLYSKDLPTFLADTFLGLFGHEPFIRPYHATNAALLGLLADDNSQPATLLESAVGFFGGGRVTDKEFPLPNDVAQVPALGAVAGLLFDSGHQAIPDDPNALYTWVNYDRVGAVATDKHGQPFTTRAAEVTDIGELARSLATVPLDFSEHFFPLRLITDSFLASLQPAKVVPQALHPDGIRRHPVLTFIGSEGLFGHGNPLGFPVPADAVRLPGYHHLDVITAAPVQNDGRPEQVAARLAAFALRQRS